MLTLGKQSGGGRKFSSTTFFADALPPPDDGLFHFNRGGPPSFPSLADIAKVNLLRINSAWRCPEAKVAPCEDGS